MGRWGHIVAVEIDRNPDKKWGVKVAKHGRSMCLRAGHDRIFLMSLGGPRRVRRLLTPAEGAVLQGMRPELLPKGLSRRLLFKGLGNAMTVPVVGQVLWIALMGVQGIVVGSDDFEESSDAAASDSADNITSATSSSEDASSSC